MKIWTITTDNNGGQTSICYSEAEADALATRIVTAWFDKCLRADEEPRDHSDWRETYGLLCETFGFDDTLTVAEHDISAHPALSAVHEILAAFEAGLLDSEDAACNEETATLVEKMIDLVEKTIGKIEADEPTLIEPMPAPELPTFTVIIAEGGIYPDPLLYAIQIENLDDEDAVLTAVAKERCVDLDLDPDRPDQLASVVNRIKLLFAFDGDLTTAEDWRV